MNADINAGEEPEPALFTLIGVDTSLSENELEIAIGNILGATINILEKNEDDNSLLFMICGTSSQPEEGKRHGNNSDDESTIIIKKFEECIKTAIYEEQNENNAATIRSKHKWILDITKVQIQIASMEEEELISEDKAYELWLTDSEANRTSNLKLVPSPDGLLIQPSHTTTTTSGDERNGNKEEATTTIKTTTSNSSSSCPKKQEEGEESSSTATATNTTIQDQVQRDPTLLEYDNVRRISISEFISSTSSFNNEEEEPIVLTGFFSNSREGKSLRESQEILSSKTLIDKFGNVVVRTGNRETLIEDGFNHSQPKTIREVLLSTNNNGNSSSTTSNNGAIIFSPIKELDSLLENNLNSIVNNTIATDNTATTTRNSIFETILNDDEPKYTLCVASQGFGIGMHKHGPAIFVLCVGRKKWYMSPPQPIVYDLSQGIATHPYFYTTKSTHKCILHPGEILYVPNQWYHEIFNLDEYTAGIQALGGDG